MSILVSSLCLPTSCLVKAKGKAKSQGKTVPVYLAIKQKGSIVCPKGWRVVTDKELASRSDPYVKTEIGMVGTEMELAGEDFMGPSCFAGAIDAALGEYREDAEKTATQLIKDWKQYRKDTAEEPVENFKAKAKIRFVEKTRKLSKIGGGSYTVKTYTSYLESMEGPLVSYIMVAVGDKAVYTNIINQRGYTVFPVYYFEFNCTEGYWNSHGTVIEKIIASFKVP